MNLPFTMVKSVWNPLNSIGANKVLPFSALIFMCTVYVWVILN